MESEGLGIIGGVIYLAVIVLIIASLWKIFTKAGRPGWESLIPIYNIYIITVKIAEKPGWWVVMFLIPFVNLVFAILVYIEVAKKFGKSSGFGVGLALLSPIFAPILAFGDAQYLDGGKDITDHILTT